ncbi:MAG TPA: SIR2 family protein [Acidimicrobiia bacterium]|jgi:hypothetical protein|nr:SIR2 family protein [Acidimicrobiia bacterium]
MTTPELDMAEVAWDYLMHRLHNGKVTPFIGAAAASIASALPSGGQLARSWAQEYDFPHDHREDEQLDLIDVAQFLSIRHGPECPKELIAKGFSGVAPPNFDAPNEAHGLLATLDLPIYLTTNYDDFMTKALEAKGKRPHREYCRWNPKVRALAEPSCFDDPDYQPTVEEPLVYHLHGIQDRPESIVITEDDYLTFIVELSWHRKQLLPDMIQQALTGTSLMFMGYGLKDWDFKVIFQALVIAMEASLRGRSVSVQLPVSDRNQRGYLAEYMCEKSIEVFWGDLDQFVTGIQSRLDEQQAPMPDASTLTRG